MSIGMILLIVVAVLILFGIAQRVLDGMRLNDKAALAVVAAMFIGGLIPSIRFSENVAINIGGAIIPFALCVYLFVRAETAWEKWRTIIGMIVTGAAVYGLGRLLPNEPEMMAFDPNYVYGIVGGTVAYILGRSRRGAFICGVMGVLLADITNAIVQAALGTSYSLNLGGAGFFDVIVLSGIIAVLLAEIFGELMEKIVRSRREKEAE
ncbi:MAG: DUF1614 domain-containing protein [Christensenellales bacterium]|jgi:uncharacterized membrane protein